MRPVRIGAPAIRILPIAIFAAAWLGVGLRCLIILGAQRYGYFLLTLAIILGGMTFCFRTADMSVTLLPNGIFVRNLIRTLTFARSDIRRFEKRRNEDCFAPGIIMQLQNGEGVALQFTGMGNIETPQVSARLERNLQILQDWLNDGGGVADKEVRGASAPAKSRSPR